MRMRSSAFMAALALMLAASAALVFAQGGGAEGGGARRRAGWRWRSWRSGRAVVSPDQHGVCG